MIIMNGNQRRNRILTVLSTASKAIPAREFADTFNVSRQVIVGDIALLRAEGHPVIATNKGYMIKEIIKDRIKKYMAVNHTKEQTRQELETFIKHGVIVESVTVEHPVYGEITGHLNIKTQEDIESFLDLKPELLSALTQGVHIHTILCQSEDNYNKVKNDLQEQGLLYEND